MALIWYLKEEFAEKNDVDKVVIRPVAIESLVNRKVDHGRLEEERFKRVNLYFF